MRNPTMEIATEWGRFYAWALNADTVRFDTTGPNPEHQPLHLKLHRLNYSSQVDVTRRESKWASRRIDDVWRVDFSEVSYQLRRFPDGGPATANAQVMLRDAVLPQLAAWLGTPDGVSVLEGGARRDRLRSIERADLAEHVLGRALDRVRGVRQTLDAGGDVGQADDQFLAFVASDLHNAEQRHVRPADLRPAESFLAGQARTTEVPGL